MYVCILCPVTWIFYREFALSISFLLHHSHIFNALMSQSTHKVRLYIGDVWKSQARNYTHECERLSNFSYHLDVQECIIKHSNMTDLLMNCRCRRVAVEAVDRVQVVKLVLTQPVVENLLVTRKSELLSIRSIAQSGTQELESTKLTLGYFSSSFLRFVFFHKLNKDLCSAWHTWHWIVEANSDYIGKQLIYVIAKQNPKFRAYFKI